MTAPASPVLGFISLNTGGGFVHARTYCTVFVYGPGGVCGGQGSHAMLLSHQRTREGPEPGLITR